jgi:hypothetical protein
LTPEPVLEFRPEETVQLLKFSVAEKIASGVNTAGNIARQFNSQLGANLVYVPTTETGPQMQQMFASLSALNAGQLSQLTALNIQPEQQRVYREMTQIPTRALKQKKAQLDLFEDKVRRFQTLVYQPASSTVTQKFRPRVQRPPQSSNLDARRPAVSVPRMPGWVK